MPKIDLEASQSAESLTFKYAIISISYMADSCKHYDRSNYTTLDKTQFDYLIAALSDHATDIKDSIHYLADKRTLTVKNYETKMSGKIASVAHAIKAQTKTIKDEEETKLYAVSDIVTALEKQTHAIRQQNTLIEKQTKSIDSIANVLAQHFGLD